MNKVIQTVSFGADPETKTYGDGKSLTSFSGYVKKRYKKEDEKDNIFQYVAFGATADFIAKYFKQGSQALITGEINNNNYEKDGVKHYSVQIVVDSIEFVGGKKDGDSANDTPKEKSSSKKSETKKSESKASDSYYDEYADF